MKRVVFSTIMMCSIFVFALLPSTVTVGTAHAQDMRCDTFGDASRIATTTNITRVTDLTGVFGADFTHYSGNPLLTIESSDPWDAGRDVTLKIPGAVHPDVQYFPDGMDGYKFWMIFTPFGQLPPGAPSPPNPSYAGDWWWEDPTLVRSNDGIHWVKTSDYTNPLISPGGQYDWDGEWLADPDFVYAPNKGPSGESWFLYYAGANNTHGSGQRIGLAMSTDGKHYTKYGATYLIPATRCPAVIYDSATGLFQMWYNWNSYDVGYATSTNGVDWTPYNPTSPGQWGYIVYQAHPGTYDQGGVSHMDVIKYQGVYHMYYNAMPTSGYSELVIGHATSPDGINWTQYPTPAITPAGQTWLFTDGTTKAVQSLYRASAIMVGDTMYLYYCGSDSYIAYPNAWNWEIGLASSAPSGPDGHLELVKDVNPAEYSPTSGTMAWYHMNEGNPSPPTYPGEYVSKDPTLAWYHFNEGTGTATADSGGAINDTGTLQGSPLPTWTTGLYGGGLSFTNGSYVTVSDSTDLNPQDAITIEAWVNPSVRKDNNYVVNKGTNGNYAYGLKVNYESSNADHSEVGAFITNPSGSYYFAYGGSVPLNTWTHIAMTYQVDSTGPSHIKLYQNGVEVSYRYGAAGVATDSIPAGTHIRALGGSLNIGDLRFYSKYFNGSLDEIRILGRALTATEIAADGSMTSTTPTVQDSSGNNNNGSPAGGVSWDTGKFSYGLKLDGSSGIVTVPHSDSLNTTNAVSIEAWVNPAVNKANNYIVIKEMPGGTEGAYGMKVTSEYAGFTEIGGWVADSAGNIYFAYGGSVPLNTWTHIAMTYEVNPTATSHVKLFQNGVEVTYRHGNHNEATDTIPAGTQIRTNTSPLTIGYIRYGSDVGHYFQGVMDELRILNRALTPGEIMEDFGTSYTSAGHLTSALITLLPGQKWDKFNAVDSRPAGTGVQYSILNGAGNTLVSPVVSGADISSLGSVPIQLRADLTTNDPASTPVLNDWCVSWKDAQPTAITLASFRAEPGAGHITLIWETATEIDTRGFNIYRAESENGNYIKINTSLIPAKGSATQGASYKFVDTAVQNRRTYYYKLEDIDLNGTATMHGPVSATPRWLFGIFGK